MRVKRRRRNLALFFIFLLILACYTTPANSVVRIMPIGDSITLGAIGPQHEFLAVGYRQHLYSELYNLGYQVDFVGGLQAGQLATPEFDTDHEGHPIWTASQVEANVYSWLENNPTDVILLHIGTNNVTTDTSDVEDILDEIDRYSEDITVILARIINRVPPDPPDPPDPKIATTTAFNNNLQTMADARIAAGDKIFVVDQESVLDYSTATDMYDSIHPNMNGYIKLAESWRDALIASSVLPPPAPDRIPTIDSTPISSAIPGKLYRYDVNAAGFDMDYYLDTKPSGMTINQTTGLIEWTPAALGNYPVQVRADNPEGDDIQNFTIQVINDTCPAGMLSHYELDQATGIFYPDSYYFNDAACTTKDNSCPAQTSNGKIKAAQVFDGIANGLDVPADSSFDWGGSDSFTIVVWMKRPSGAFSSAEVFIGRRDDSNDLQWWVGLFNEKASFTLKDTANNGAGKAITASTNLTDGEWHHIVAVRDGVSGKNYLYVDGLLKEETDVITYTHGFDSATAPINIGWLDSGSGSHFEGTLDEIALYNRALSGEDVAEHYKKGKAGTGLCRKAYSILNYIVPILSNGQN